MGGSRIFAYEAIPASLCVAELTVMQDQSDIRDNRVCYVALLFALPFPSLCVDDGGGWFFTAPLCRRCHCGWPGEATSKMNLMHF